MPHIGCGGYLVDEGTIQNPGSNLNGAVISCEWFIETSDSTASVLLKNLQSSQTPDSYSIKVNYFYIIILPTLYFMLLTF